MSCELLAGEIEFRAALRQHALAVADLLDRVLMLPLGHFERRFGGVEHAARRETAIEERLHAIAVEARLLRDGAPLAHEAGVLEDPLSSSSPVGRQAEAHPRLDQRGLGLAEPELEIGGEEAREDLPLLTGLPRSTLIASTRPGTLKARAT